MSLDRLYKCEHVALSVLKRHEARRMLEKVFPWWELQLEPLRLNLCELPLFSGQQHADTDGVYETEIGQRTASDPAEQQQPRFRSKKKIAVSLEGSHTQPNPRLN